MQLFEGILWQNMFHHVGLFVLQISLFFLLGNIYNSISVLNVHRIPSPSSVNTTTSMSGDSQGYGLRVLIAYGKTTRIMITLTFAIACHLSQTRLSKGLSQNIVEG